MIVKFKKLHKNAVTPIQAKVGDAGFDLTAVEETYNGESDYWSYDFGLSIEIPTGYVGLLFPRSSITKTDMYLSNSVGVLDSGYRGPISARFRYNKKYPKKYSIGDRVIQLVIVPYLQAIFVEIDQLSETDRGIGGFGSTGE